MTDLCNIRDLVVAKIDDACARAHRNPKDVEIIAVTKTHGPETVREALDAGFRIVGENKVQEAAWKKQEVSAGASWHLIGHLQRNKVRLALETFDFFHSVDSIPLVDRMATVANEMGLKPHILLEVNMSGERSKSGMAPQDVPAVIERVMAAKCFWLEGFMTMAPFVPPEKIEETRPIFAGLRELRDGMEQKFGIHLPRLSMGMTNDYPIAVEEGATWVRLGTVLFGERPKLNAFKRTADLEGERAIIRD